ncbi:MAG TPA: hypothetical protein VE999_14595 [Gemmataceae bacterium]|nr:hypothetical protein [Gemmataceae bacterium]
MNTIDLVILAVGIIALTVWLLFDRVARAIVWESLRHPFTRSRIEMRDGKIHVTHLSSGAARQSDQPSGAK